ncbi:glycosyltransferase family 39 protein [Micromonospora sp. NPDC049559]|uniref:dolichyl-phosphate-mannose--protein mannosyltransferase n=1 Tax=Micromonospora sp. NPDC049559 TaxID=3155923 RepID=UPI00341749A8
MATRSGPLRPAAGGVPAIVRRRLVPFDARLDAYSWLATGVVVAIAAILRFVGLSQPKGKIFDEVYYATDAHNLLVHGFEWDDKNNTAAYVVHPPLGKWLIGIGEQIFGYNELGWRFSAAVVGTLSVLLLVRIARRLFHSTVLGCAAGLLLALDGFHLVLSRTALLDIFLLFFVLAAFGALVLDRDARRRRWLRAMEAGLDPSRPGRSGRLPLDLGAVPWWRLLSAVLLGCAMSVKWSALWFVPAFALLVLFWEAGARRSAGVRRPWRDTLIGETGWLVLAGVLFTLTYLASWSGWFLTDGGYFRHWQADRGMTELPVIGALQNLLHYHQEALKFHTGLQTKHTYQSWPWQWLLLGRPVAFYWSTDGACGAPSCASEILLLGTPILWWSFLPALVALGWLGFARRDWRAGAILLCVAAGLLPWFYYAIADGRTMFSFYVAPALPFLVLAVVYVLGAIMTPAEGPGSAGAPPPGRVPAPATGEDGADTGGPVAATAGAGTGAEAEAAVAAASEADMADADRTDRRLVGAIIAGAYVLLVALCFAYFHPIFVGKVMQYADWSARMWLGSRWI